MRGGVKQWVISNTFICIKSSEKPVFHHLRTFMNEGEETLKWNLPTKEGPLDQTQPPYNLVEQPGRASRGVYWSHWDLFSTKKGLKLLQTKLPIPYDRKTTIPLSKSPNNSSRCNQPSEFQLDDQYFFYNREWKRLSWGLSPEDLQRDDLCFILPRHPRVVLFGSRDRSCLGKRRRKSSWFLYQCSVMRSVTTADP